VNLSTIQKTGIVLGLIISLFLTTADAQNDGTAEPEKDKRPVKSPFEAGFLINSQTIVVSSPKTLEFDIQHRFGKINSQGIKDLLGIYGASNIRLGVSYTPIKNLQVGFGTVKNYKLQDLSWKWSILQQTRSGSMPFAVTYYGNAVYDARDKSNFMNPDPADSAIHSSWRFAYFHQIIIARKFSKAFSMQIAPGIAHFNYVDSTSAGISPEMKHDVISISTSGRVNLTPQFSIIAEFDYQLNAPEEIKPNLGMGFEISTGSHAFQFFASPFGALSNAHDYSRNQNDFAADKPMFSEIMFGFNISRLWHF